MTSNERILQPFTLPNGTELKNRLLMAPMTTCTGYFDGTVTSELVEYYRARAGSIGTIIVECCFIDDYGLAFPGAIGIDNDEKIAGLAKIAEAIKAEGSKAISADLPRRPYGRPAADRGRGTAGGAERYCRAA
ncbi:hypothetical protein ACB371_12450 [Klebsiella pneumoniae]